MTELLFVLIVVFLAVSGRKKKNGPAGKGAPAKAKAPAAKAEPAEMLPRSQHRARADAAQPEGRQAFLERLQKEMRERMELPDAAPEGPIDGAREARKQARREEKRARRAAAAEAAAIVQADEEGCVGGSMAHEHTEGESRAEHARHQEAIRRRETQELLAHSDEELSRRATARRMREAVVMAEVLGRPVALRPHSGGRRAIRG